MSSIAEKTEAAFHVWREAVKAKKTISETIKDSQEACAPLAAVQEEYETARDARKGELDQWKASNELLLKKLDAASQEVKDAKDILDELYVAAKVEAGQGKPVQLTLLDEGKSYGIELVTRVKAQKAERQAEPNEETTEAE